MRRGLSNYRTHEESRLTGETLVLGKSESSLRPRERLTREHLVLIGLCAVGYFVDGLSSAILGPFAPAVARSLTLSKTEIGSLFSANLLGQCLGLVIIPLFEGRIGPRRTIVWSTVLFGLADVASGLAGNRNELLICRLLIGIGIGGTLPAAISLVAELAPPGRRGTSLMSLILAFALGPVFAGLMGSLFTGTGDGSWRWALMSVGAVSLLAATAQGLWLTESPSFLRRRGGTPATAKKNNAAAAPWLLFSPVLLRGTLILWTIVINAVIVSYCLMSWLPTLLVDTGRNARLGAMALTSFSLGGVLSTLVVGPLIDRIGAFRTLGVSFAASALFLSASAMGLRSAPDLLLLTLLAAAGFCLLGAYGGVNVLMAEFYPVPLRAVGTGWAKSAGRIGTVLAPLLVGWALTRGVREQDIFLAFAVPAVLAMLGIVGMQFESRRRALIKIATAS
jgi:AAHS family 4-hydroxybenzoate transporter-like MFS transporter